MSIQYVNVKYSDVRSLIQEADILLFRNTGFFPYWIKQATESPYTHVALASWLYNDKGEKIHLECVEFREWRGGRVVNLSTLVKLFNKEIDVYRVSDCLPYLEYDGRTKSVIKKLKKMRAEDITHCMRNLTGMTYGWKRLLWLSRFHLGFLRLIPSSKVFNDKLSDEIIYPICSTTVAHCYQKHYVDLTHNCCNERMEPSDIARSPILNYLFTLEW